MKKSHLQLFIWILAGGILLLAGCASNPTAADVDAAKAAIEEIWEKYSSAADSGDTDIWLSLWDEAGIQLPPNGPAVSKQALEEKVIPAFAKRREAGVKRKMNILPEEITVAGDWAYSRGTYNKTTYLEDGKTTYFEGKFLTILKRQPDGSWKIYRDCFNSSMPPPK